MQLIRIWIQVNILYLILRWFVLNLKYIVLKEN
jgi:hypothetical protein